MSKSRYVLEGEWSGYTSSQQRVVHREVVSKKTAEAANELGSIRYTDGTCLYLSARPCKPREKVQTILGYRSLINDCLMLGVSSVAELEPARKALRESYRRIV